MQDTPDRPDNQILDRPHHQKAVDLFDEDIRPLPNGSGLPPTQNKRSGGWILFVVVLLILVVIVFAFLAFGRGRAPSPSGGAGVGYRSQAVVQGNLSLTVNATGPVQGTLYNADFVVTGKISQINVSVGQHVKAGQVLAQLDTTTLPSGTSSSNATLTAPHAGTVAAINGAVGASSNVGNATLHFIQIVDTSSLQILAAVNEADIAKVAANNAVQFTVNAYGTQQFYGSVSAIAPQGQTTSNVVTYPVTINIDSSRLNGANIMPGMTANVTITTSTRTNVLLIPVDAVNFAQNAVSQGLISPAQAGNALAQAHQQQVNLQGAGSGSSVAQDNPSATYVLTTSGGQLTAIPVVLGLNDGNVYEVLSGLTEGETIVTSSPAGTTPVTSQNTNQGQSGGNIGKGG